MQEYDLALIQMARVS